MNDIEKDYYELMYALIVLLELKSKNVGVTDTPFWTANFTIPGHESFDRDGNPKLTSLMLTSVISRSHVMNRPYNNAGHVFLDWPSITKNNFTFVSSTQFTMSRSLYSAEVLKQPLDEVFVMGYVRNSSMGSVSHFYTAGKTIEEPLWTQLNQLVYIDRETRKPTALPDWYKNKYKDKGCMEKPVFFNPLDRPSPTYKQSVVVQWSDTDNFKHTICQLRTLDHQCHSPRYHAARHIFKHCNTF
ncbi:uncharacterized protein LOC131935311 [Physella acuta]|uniref:uncharacterized protein LOC131935311 n=1 Tax=Physella acuta TaxID=109671 RepID=UPI0027DB66A5|nr:uncharacterized protein LOC131935311 [Physella acuta]